jgi:hypothetical protein
VRSDVSVLWRRSEEDGVFYFVATSIDNPKVGSFSLGFIPAFAKMLLLLRTVCRQTNASRP